MYIVIVGAGRIGVPIARWLISADHEVALVERSAAKCAAIEDELGNVAVVGDGAEAGVLAKAGTSRADVLIAATGLDDVNLVTCQLARHRFGVSRTITLVNNPEYRRLFELLGIGMVINVTELIVGNLREELSGLLSDQNGELG